MTPGDSMSRVYGWWVMWILILEPPWLSLHSWVRLLRMRERPRVRMEQRRRGVLWSPWIILLSVWLLSIRLRLEVNGVGRRIALSRMVIHRDTMALSMQGSFNIDSVRGDFIADVISGEEEVPNWEVLRHPKQSGFQLFLRCRNPKSSSSWHQGMGSTCERSPRSCRYSEG